MAPVQGGDRLPCVRRGNTDSQPVLLTTALLRPALCSDLRCFLASGCSTYCKYALRAPQVEKPTSHYISRASRREVVRSTG